MRWGRRVASVLGTVFVLALLLTAARATAGTGHAGPSAAALAQASGNCALYPIALNAQTLAGVAPGTTVADIPNGAQPGGFVWLSWIGDPGTPALWRSLTPPGDSHTYVNPDDPTDHAVSVGDWVRTRPGASNSTQARAALDRLRTLDITVPVWDVAAGQGANTRVRVAAFARLRLTD